MKMYVDARPFVIEESVLFEYNLSLIICKLLDIDISKSKSFGNSSSSLSFANKVNLLLDINVIDKNDKLKFEKLSEIRNQFAHNKDASDFTKCFSCISGLKTFLEKLYGSNIDKLKNEEAQNSALFQNLLNDLTKILKKFIGAIIKKESDFQNAMLNQKYIETIDEFSNSDEYFANKLKKVAELFEKKLNS